MNIQFLIALAEAYAHKGEATLGTPTATKSFSLAAEKYRELSKAIPERSEEFSELAKQCDEKASSPPPTKPTHIPTHTMGVIYQEEEFNVEKNIEEINSLVFSSEAKKQLQ